jgi:hypothetical protein
MVFTDSVLVFTDSVMPVSPLPRCMVQILLFLEQLMITAMHVGARGREMGGSI